MARNLIISCESCLKRELCDEDDESLVKDGNEDGLSVENELFNCIS